MQIFDCWMGEIFINSVATSVDNTFLGMCSWCGKWNRCFIYLFDLFKFLDFIKPNIVKDDEEKGFQ